MKNFDEILSATKIFGPGTEEADFLFPLVVAFSHAGLLKGCGKHCDKFSLATECLHMYVHFLTFRSKGPEADVCRLIYAPFYLDVTSPRTEKQSSLEKSDSGLMKYMDTALKGRK